MKNLMFFILLGLPLYCLGQDEVVAQFKVLALATKGGNDEPWSVWDYAIIRKESKALIITINTNTKTLKINNTNTLLKITYAYPAKKTKTLTGKITEVREIYCVNDSGEGVKVVLSVFPNNDADADAKGIANAIIYRQINPKLWTGYLCTVNENIR